MDLSAWGRRARLEERLEDRGETDDTVADVEEHTAASLRVYWSMKTNTPRVTTMRVIHAPERWA